MTTFGTITPDISTLRLYDVCSAFKAAFDRFEEHQTGENWEAVLVAAQEFRAKVKLLDGERV